MGRKYLEVMYLVRRVYYLEYIKNFYNYHFFIPTKQDDYDKKDGQ